MVKKIKIFDYITINNIKNIFSKNTEIYILRKNVLSNFISFFKIKKILIFENNFNNLNSNDIEKFTSIFENDEVGKFVYDYIDSMDEVSFEDKNFVNFVVKYFCNNSNLISFMSIENFLYFYLIIKDKFKDKKIDFYLKDNIFNKFINTRFRNNNINFIFYKKSFDFLILKNYLSMIKKLIFSLKSNNKYPPKKYCIMDSYPINKPYEFFNENQFNKNTVFISNEKINRDNILYIYDFVNFKSIKTLLLNLLTSGKNNYQNLLKLLFTRYSFEKEIYKNFFQIFNIKTFYSCYITHDFTSSAIAAIHEVGGYSIGVTYSYSERFNSFQNIDAFDYFISFNNDNYKYKKYSNLKEIKKFGYVLDYKFKKYTSVSLDIREKLLNTGAKYIIGFFDQGSNDNNLFNYLNHDISRKSYVFLLEKVLINENYALVIKPKKPRLLKHKLGDAYYLIDKAKKTGRCLIFDESDNEHVKNFKDIPAKIAMICDITIHDMLIAGTAGLESALNGTKSVYFDYYNSQKNQFESDGLNIVFRDWSNLWKSIENEYKNRGNNLGNWTNIISNFDKYRDGKTNQRIMNFLSNL